MKNLTCREHCWKYKLCEVGQDKNTLCRFFEPKSNFLGEKDDDPTQKYKTGGIIQR